MLKLIISSLFVLLCSVISYCQDFTLTEQLSIGGTGIDGVADMTIVEDQYIWAIYSDSPIGIDKTVPNYGNYDYWIVSTDATYSINWQKSFGGNESDQLNGIVKSSEAIYIYGSSWSDISGNKTVGSFGQEDCWIIKVDYQGNEIWQKSFGGNKYDNVLHALVLPNGNVLFAGTSRSDMSGTKTEANRGSYDVWLVCINSDGDILWDKTLGGEGSDSGIKLILNESDELFLLATSSSDIGYEKTEANIGLEDIWLLNINSDNGAVLWDKTIGSVGIDISTDIQSVDDSFYILSESTGEISGHKTEDSRGGNDYWVIKTDNSGNVSLDKTLGSLNTDTPTFIFHSDSTGFIVGGNSNSDAAFEKTEDSYDVSNFSEDFWIICLNSDLEKVWDKTIGGGDRDIISGCLPLLQNSLMMYGSSSSDISFDRTVSLNGTFDVWISEMQIPQYSTISVNEKDILICYPNPVYDQLFFNIENISNVRVSTVTGQTVLYKPNPDNQIDFGHLPSGIYLITVIAESKIYTSKIIKQ